MLNGVYTNGQWGTREIHNGDSVTYEEIMSSSMSFNLTVDPKLMTTPFVEIKVTSKDAHGNSLGEDTIKAHFMPEMMVDANRDGKMSWIEGTDTDPDGLTQAIHNADQNATWTPYTFWLNDDHDAWSAADNTETDVATAPANNADTVINGKRDLEDIARLWLSFRGMTSLIKASGIAVQMEWKPENGSEWSADAGSPAIRLFKHVEAGGGMNPPSIQQKGKLPGYLLVDSVAGTQVSSAWATAIGTVGTDAPLTLPLLINGLNEQEAGVYLLFEGVRAGRGRLTVTIKKDGMQMGQASLLLEIKPVMQMYERWTVGDGDGGNPQPVATPSWRDLPGGVTAPFRYINGGPEWPTYILFVHGWNMEPAGKDAFAETAFKRLWWQGYQGRFGAFQWPTGYGFNPTTTWRKAYQGTVNGTHYDRSERVAWESAAPLAALLARLNGQNYGVHLLGHSMGNVVCGEALRLLVQGGTSIQTYVAMEAAVQAELYDLAVAGSYGLHFYYDHPELPGGAQDYGPTTADAWKGWLVASGNGAGRRVNFYNENDFALNEPIWEFDQITKPDWPDYAHGQPWWYGYTGSPADAPVVNGFYRCGNPVGIGRQTLWLGGVDGPRDRYEIYAFASEPRSRALGRTPGAVQGFGNGVNLQDFWTNDLQGNAFKGRAWHSGQFNFDCATNWKVWEKVLKACGIIQEEP